MNQLNSYNEELSDREIAALHRENTGPAYKRVSVIKDRVVEAHIEAATTPVVPCDFKNKYGWCLKPEGHKDSHTVVWLGDDGE